MLISFAVKNWMSFLGETKFSMIASKERQHGDRIARVKKYGIGILPVAVLYGGNASGKTNFLHAVNFARSVVRGMWSYGSVPVRPFMLNERAKGQPSCFKFRLLAEEQIYEYSFAITECAVLEEKLVQVNKTSEKLLYSRVGQEIKFGKKIPKQKILDYVFQGTRENELFLTISVNQKVDYFRMVYDWFASINLVSSDSRFGSFEQFTDSGNKLYEDMELLLAQLDTGVSGLYSHRVPINILKLSDDLKDELKERVREGNSVRIVGRGAKDNRYLVTKIDGELVARMVVARHKGQGGGDVAFSASQESDGTNRLIDLLPAFIDLGKGSGTKVYAIDEIDRSLHTLLVEKLIRSYLAGCSPDTRKQLFVTTHNVMLMDQKLFRRDEMWLTERDSDGASKLFPFSDFKDVRYDKDVRRSYLQGRLGGIPDIADVEIPTSAPDEHAD